MLKKKNVFIERERRSQRERKEFLTVMLQFLSEQPFPAVSKRRVLAEEGARLGRVSVASLLGADEQGGVQVQAEGRVQRL